MNKDNKILIIRSAPLPLFKSILNKVAEDYNGARFTFLVQDEVREQFILKGIELLSMPQGMFNLKNIQESLLSKIEEQRFELLVVPVNNILYEGYTEIVKLAIQCGIPQLVMMREDFSSKQFNALAMYKYLLVEKLRKLRSKLSKAKREAVNFFVIILAKIMAIFNREIVLLGLPNRIGHLAVEPDSYLKEHNLSLKKVRPVLIVDESKVANKYLFNYWKKFFSTVNSKFLQDGFTHCREKINSICVVSRLDNHKYIDVVNRSKRKPLLVLSEKDKEIGRQILREMGVPKDAWFVCFHGREAGFLPELRYHSYRDVDIENYLLAVSYIVEQGGWAIRLGEPTMKPIVKMKQVIDYAHHELRSDFMDIFLAAECLFFLGSGSGINSVSNISGVPVAWTNMIPLGAKPHYPDDLFILKLLYSKREERYLTLQEIMTSAIGMFFRTEEYENLDIVVEENNPEDIRDMTKEMYLRIKGKIEYDAIDVSLQDRYEELHRKNPTWFSRSQSRLGRDFLRKYGEQFILNDKVVKKVI